jgi:hypothetical protein
MHSIRHTTLTWVERNFGYAVARASDGGSETGATWRSEIPVGPRVVN